MGTEKRKHTRHIREEFGVTLLRDGRELHGFDMMVCDVSQSGVGLQLNAEVRQGDVLSMRLELPGGRSLLTDGDVRWVEETPMGYRCGVSFAGLGVFGAYTLKQFLEPFQMDLLGEIDSLLWAAVLSVMAVAGAQAIGWDIAGPTEIVEFYVNLFNKFF